MAEIVEKGFMEPSPYKSVYKAYKEAFPDVNLPPFVEISGNFYESSPLNFMIQDKKINEPQTLKRVLEHFGKSRTYWNEENGKREISVLRNDFLPLVYLATVGKFVIDRFLPDIQSNQAQPIMQDATILSLATLTVLFERRTTAYHEFAHLVHHYNRKGEEGKETFVNEYLTDVAAWHAMQKGTFIDKVASIIYPLLKPEYIFDFARKGGRKIVPQSQEKSKSLAYLNGLS